MNIQSRLIPEWLKKKILLKLYARDVESLIAKRKIPDLEKSLLRLQQQGIYPKLIFDVGSYHGEFMQASLNIWPGTKIIGFEALPEKIEFLKKKFKGQDVTLVECILGDSDRDDVLFYTDDSASSTLKSDEVATKKGTIRQRMIKLDSYVTENNLGAPNFLHIDTLSSEFEILKGFESNLHAVEMIVLQVNFIEVFEGVKLAHELFKFLSQFGFVAYDVCDIHRRPLDMALWQIDFLFLKSDSVLRSNRRWG